MPRWKRCWANNPHRAALPSLEDGPSTQLQEEHEVADGAATAPAAADDGGYKFKPGQRVELLRTDGAFSPGTVVMGFEGVFDVLYKVKLDNGLFKEAVPEEDLSEQCCEVGDLFDGF